MSSGKGYGQTGYLCIYLSIACAHPGGGVMGAPGRIAVKQAIYVSIYLL